MLSCIYWIDHVALSFVLLIQYIYWCSNAKTCLKSLILWQLSCNIEANRCRIIIAIIINIYLMLMTCQELFKYSPLLTHFLGGAVVKNVPANARDAWDPWVGKIPWSRKWEPTPIPLPGKFHGQRRLVSYRPWGHKESDTAEWLSVHAHTHIHTHTHTLLIHLILRRTLEEPFIIIPILQMGDQRLRKVTNPTHSQVAVHTEQKYNLNLDSLAQNLGF